MLTNTNHLEMQNVLKRLCLRIDQYNAAEKLGCNIAYSVGGIEYNSNKNQSIAELITEADKLMYIEKKAIKDSSNTRLKLELMEVSL